MNDHMSKPVDKKQRDETVKIVVYERYKSYQRKEMLIFACLPLLGWVFNIIDVGCFFAIPVVGFLLGLPFILFIHIGYLYTFRNKIILPLQKRLSLPRKLITSWSNRLLYITLGSLDIAMKFVPFGRFVEPLSLSFLIIANTFLAYRYYKWQYEREINNQDLLLIEKGIVFGFFCIAFLCIAIMCTALYFIGERIENYFM